MQTYLDWGEVSEKYDLIKQDAISKELNNESEAQTRFDIIDRIIKEILQWKHGQISVEEFVKGEKEAYIDYLLKCGDLKIVIEAKKIGASFPNPTRRKKLKLTGSVLSEGEIGKAISQAETYAREKDADVVVVTNGTCWCFYPLDSSIEKDLIYAYLLFPFEDVKDAEELFNWLAIPNVEKDSLSRLGYENPYISVNSLANVTRDADARIGRNNIADHIAPALDYAFHGESLIGEEAMLKFCYVKTDARTKYDNSLKMFLADRKPGSILTAKRIKKDWEQDELHLNLQNLNTNKNIPVTLLIGSVGAGKSTYLSQFELIQAKDLLEEKKCFWVYIDFEKMGATGEPRKFIYETLKEFCLNEHPYVKTDYKSLVEPAYEDEIKKLARGPFGLAAKNKEKFNEKIQEIIENDYTDVERYVEKIYGFIAKNHLTVIVLDNIDLYENAKLEIEVFSEGVALSKKINCNVIVSIRDTTYVKHKNESIFNAYELKRFWLDPPPFREVLSRRLKFASLALKDKKATIPYNGMSLVVENLSVFFDIAHSTLLRENSARLIECLADGNIRKGITLVNNFLTSGHIQADRALSNYLDKRVVRGLPFHEVFKGSVLGTWRYYKEDRAEVINIFNSGFNSRSLQFLRIYILKYLFFRAKDKNTLDTPVKKIIESFSSIGASENHIIKTLNDLYQNRLINSIDARIVDINSVIVITLTGGYYYNVLARQFEYLENILFDTPIFNDEIWEYIYSVNDEIKHEGNIVSRVLKRKERMVAFLDYIKLIEQENIKQSSLFNYSIAEEIEGTILFQLQGIVSGARFYY